MAEYWRAATRYLPLSAVRQAAPCALSARGSRSPSSSWGRQGPCSGGEGACAECRELDGDRRSGSFKRERETLGILFQMNDSGADVKGAFEGVETGRGDLREGRAYEGPELYVGGRQAGKSQEIVKR